jgi:hypothetical protein
MRAILTKVTDEMYLEIRRRMNQYGFKSVYEFIHGVVGMALNEMARMDYRREHPGELSIKDEIDEMFAPLENWESPKYGERTKRGHNPWDIFGEQDDEVMEIPKEDCDECEEDCDDVEG